MGFSIVAGLPYESAHSKLVKTGVPLSCLGASVKVSCQHKLTEVLAEQDIMLEKAGYPECIILGVVEKIVKEKKRTSIKENKKKTA